MLHSMKLKVMYIVMSCNTACVLVSVRGHF